MAAAPTPSVRFFGPEADQSARIGTQNAAQSFTPAAKTKALKTTLRTMWKTNVGKTNERTTIVAGGGRLVIGTLTGVHVLDARTGESRASISAPDHGAIAGVALGPDNDSVVFASESGHVVRASANGGTVWAARSESSIAAAPTLVDLNGDGALDAVVGTGGGMAIAFDGATGRKLWEHPIGGPRRYPIEAGISAGDLDKDGRPELVVGGGEGLLTALRGDGSTLWQTKLSAKVAAAPLLADVDGDTKLEVLAASADGTVGILDGASGRSLWSARVERDDGQPEGIVATPALLPGPRFGSIVVATSKWGKSDGLVVLSETERRYRSLEGPISSSPVVLRLDPDGTPDAIVGTEIGDVVAIDAIGGRTFLANVRGAIVAPLFVTDVDGDGARELIVVTKDGALQCWSTGVADVPVIGRYRGNAMTNAGAIGTVDLGWTFARGRDAPLLK